MHRPLPSSRLRGLVVALTLAGYLLVLGGSSVGQGWTLLAHLAGSHATPTFAGPQLHMEAPEVHSEDPSISTLRQHTHGAHTHHDGHTHTDEEHRPVWPRTLPVYAPGPAVDFHEHDGVLHTHDTPDREPSLLPIIALDDHRLPEAVINPSPKVRETERDAGPERLRSTDLPVETPPPNARG